MSYAIGTAVFSPQYSLSPPTLPLPPLQLVYMLHGSSTEEKFPLGMYYHFPCSHIFLVASYVTGSIHGCLHNLHHLSPIF